MSIEEVAQLLCELYGDTCACNYNGIDEYLPERCVYATDASCPNPEDPLGCWKQYVQCWLEDHRD